jgi:hypothetical protein
LKTILLTILLAWGAAAVASPDNPKHGYFRNDGTWVELKPNYADGTLLQNGEIEVYVLQDGVRHCIPDPPTFRAMSFDLGAIIHVTDAELAEVPEGTPFLSLGFEKSE